MVQIYKAQAFQNISSGTITILIHFFPLLIFVTSSRLNVQLCLTVTHFPGLHYVPTIYNFLDTLIQSIKRVVYFLFDKTQSDDDSLRIRRYQLCYFPAFCFVQACL